MSVIANRQGYLKDSNAVGHSVNSDIIYIVVYIPACSNLSSVKSWGNFFLKKSTSCMMMHQWQGVTRDRH